MGDLRLELDDTDDADEGLTGDRLQEMRRRVAAMPNYQLTFQQGRAVMTAMTGRNHREDRYVTTLCAEGYHADAMHLGWAHYNMLVLLREVDRLRALLEERHNDDR